MTKNFFYTYYRRQGNKIFMRYIKDGVAKNRVIDFYEPVVYIKTTEESEYTNIYGDYVKPLPQDSMRGADKFTEQYKHVEGMEIHGNNDYANQFIIELFKGETPDYDPKAIKIAFVDIEVFAEEFPDPDIHRWPINAITVYNSAKEKYFTWGLETDTPYNLDKRHVKTRDLNVEYMPFTDEKELLRSFLSHMNAEEYHITTGWNSELFDWPYIINRCYLLFGDAYTKKMLSPFNHIQKINVPDSYGGTKTKYKVLGVPDLDYLALYKKHVFTPRESYRLDFIAEAELGERKLDYSDYSSLDTLYTENYQLFIDYNIVDVDIVRRLDERLGLFDQTYALSYYALTNFEDTLGTVRIWEHLIAKFLYTKNKVPLYFGIKGTDRAFQGAYVKEPIPGMYEWVVSVDLNSLYPMIEIQYNIGPETHMRLEQVEQRIIENGDSDLVEFVESGQFRSEREQYMVSDIVHERISDEFKKCVQVSNVTMAGNFHFYDKGVRSFISDIKRELYAQRSVVKDKMLELDQLIADAKSDEERKQYESPRARQNNMQMALKILLNAGYGALGNAHFLYYMVDNAEAITASGRLINQWTGTRVEKFLKKTLGKDHTYWVYSDTDSGYFNLNPFVKQVFGEQTEDKQLITNTVDQFYKDVLGPEIDHMAQDLCDYVNGYEQMMVWGREVIAERAVWLARKRYVMTVWDNEGVRFHGEPKLKYMGVDAVRSSTPAWSREALKKCYMIALTEGEKPVQQYISEVYEDFLSKRIDEIAIPTGVNGLEKYADDDLIYTKGTPKHVKAALIHNHLVDKKQLNVNKITSGNKIKYVPLKQPNPCEQEVIAFEQFLPEGFDLEDYVDYDSVFQRAFTKPIDAFLNPIGWTSEELNTLF